MKRFIEDILIKWKDEKGRKPLILSGARQVGKSYVIEQNFARQFEREHYQFVNKVLAFISAN
jgi:predicted AAA+ superfamily ATPase